MEKIKIIESILNGSNGIAKTADFVEAGISRYDVFALCKQGFLERIRHGYYQAAGNQEITEPQILKSLIPEGIVCVESALFKYGYSDFVPRHWSIAVPREISLAKLRIDNLPIKSYFIQRDLYLLGRTSTKFDDVFLPIYDRERTICDCFKYQSRLDAETFGKALKAYSIDERKNMKNLTIYARQMRVWNKMSNMMGIILNG